MWGATLLHGAPVFPFFSNQYSKPLKTSRERVRGLKGLVMPLGFVLFVPPLTIYLISAPSAVTTSSYLNTFD